MINTVGDPEGDVGNANDRPAQVRRGGDGDDVATDGSRTGLSERFAAGLPEIDAALWLVAPLLGVAIATPDVSEPNWWALLSSGAASAAAVLTFNSLQGAYRPRSEDAEARVMRAMWRSHLVALLVLLALLTLTSVDSPIAVAVGGALASSVASTIVHSFWRSRIRRRRAAKTGHPSHPADPRPVVVLGTGGLAHEIARQLELAPAPTFEVVALLDDDLTAHGRTLAGARVEGLSSDVLGVAEHHDASAVLLAVRSAPSSLVREMTARCEGSGVEVLVLPSDGELPAGSQIGVDDIRSVTPYDYFARRSTDVDLAEHGGYVNNECVVVTGAAGELGTELTKRVASLEPRRLVLIDIDEAGLEAVASSLDIEARRTVCADIADSEAIEAVFQEEKPAVVLHAAGVTDATLLSDDPSIGLHTNVVGTQVLLDAAAKAGTGTFVHLSCADAADPSGTYGHTKSIAEGLVAAAANEDRRYVSARMGTVVGTRNSVLGALVAQIESGRPVEVAHPGVDRFFITTDEAVDLTLAAGSLTRPGEVALFEAGEPVRDLDIALYLIKRSGRPVPIEFRGLAPGEKLHQGLRGTDDIATADDSGLMWHTAVRETQRDVVAALTALDDPDELVAALASQVPAVEPATELSILLSPPEVSTTERQALVRAFDSGWIAPAGPELAAFEAELCEYTGAEAAVALGSGSAGLHLALVAHGIGPGDEVVVQNATFAVTAFAVTYTGATPVFCDIDRSTMTLDPDLLAELLAEKERQGTLPKAVMPVDIYGMVADYERIRAVCAPYGIPIIQDAAESLGSKAAGQMAGTQGDLGVVSFNGNKIITTSGGGALLGPAEVIDHVRKLSTQAREPVLHYEHAEIGFNYRMSNLLAALGRAQLARLDDFVERRNVIADRYAEGLEQLDWFPMGVTDRANRWLNVALLPEGFEPADLCATLAASGVEARPAWYPMDRQPVFADHESHRTGVADELFARGICLPSGSGLTDAEQQFVIGEINAAVGVGRRSTAAA